MIFTWKSLKIFSRTWNFQSRKFDYLKLPNKQSYSDPQGITLSKDNLKFRLQSLES